jgi:hypothetical protein
VQRASTLLHAQRQSKGVWRRADLLAASCLWLVATSSADLARITSLY